MRRGLTHVMLYGGPVRSKLVQLGIISPKVASEVYRAFIDFTRYSPVSEANFDE